ncbi:MAG: cyclic nucleotide-binding domain-containing protein, partial [Proteobacteria bacterium]|nr:cyclic nucleotide-binding domain-containing protein [Pseudomonadota bacterium]
PENVGITLKLAEVYAKAGNKESAIDNLKEAAESYSSGGDFLKAAGVYKMILKVDPENKEANDKLDSLCSTENSKKKEWTLPEIPLLSDLKEEVLKKVVGSLAHHTFSMGEIIFREGDEGNSLYIIVKGSVKVFIEGVAGEKIEITQLKEGDFFGEVGLLAGGTRKASVMALDDTDLFEMTKEEIEKIEKEHPHVSDVLQDFYKKRVLDKIMAVSPLFGTLKTKDRREILEAFTLKSFNEGDAVITEGEKGDSLFIIKSGQVEVNTVADDEKKVMLGRLKEGDFFGEVALLTGKPRTATVTALSPVELMELSAKDLKSCFEKHTRVKETLNRYLKVRVEKTISTIMALKQMEAREGLV